MKHIWLLILLTACTLLPPSPGRAGLLIPSEHMPRWASQPTNFQLSADELEIGSELDITVGPADYSWGIIYVLTDSKNWERVTISSLTKDPIVKQWVKGTARFTLDMSSNKFTPGYTYYAIGYLCNKGKTWQCNDNKWMLLSFKVKGSKQTIMPPSQSEEAEILDVESEIDQLEKELDDLDNDESLLDELP